MLTEASLLQTAQSLRGMSLTQLAQQLGVEVPAVLKHAKGWAGQLIEKALGATAGSLPVPDFPQLGLELKTIPVDAQGVPIESTFICSVQLTDITGLTFEKAWVYQKLKRILWVPLLSLPHATVGARQLGQPKLWSPSEEEWQQLRLDWEELMEMIALGQLDKISARQGEYLQIRPKAANARARSMGIGAEGELITTLPRGFYLRRGFTTNILLG